MVNIGFELKTYKNFPWVNTKIWLHRGGNPPNSLKGIKEAIVKGVNGIEIDIHYNEYKKDFVVIHDRPDFKKLKSYLKLEMVLSSFKANKVSWWLDLKNLNMSNKDNTQQRLKTLENKYNLKGRYFIESNNFLPTMLLSWSKIPTAYWINPHSKSRIFIIRSFFNKLQLLIGNFVGVTAYYKSLHEKSNKLLSNVPTAVFTINDPTLIKKFESMKNVKVLLTDNI